MRFLIFSKAEKEVSEMLELFTFLIHGEAYPVGIENVFSDQMFKDFQRLLIPASILALAYCGFQLMTAQSERQAAAAKTRIIVILAVLMLGYVLPGAITSLKDVIPTILGYFQV